MDGMRVHDLERENEELRRILRRQGDVARKLDVWWRSTRAVMSAEEAHDVANLLMVLVGHADLYDLVVSRSRRDSGGGER